jgi:hypothetical protein
MKQIWLILLGMAAGVAMCLLYEHLQGSQDVKGLQHVRNSFAFVVDTPLAKVFPLFGADREQVWSQGWKPRFIYPSPTEDVPGAVFRVNHGHHKSVWVNTAFDEPAGHVQYVYFISDVLVTLIDIHLTQLDGQRTQVQVVYERTALSADANNVVAQHGEADANAGPEWQEQINSYLQKGN